MCPVHNNSKWENSKKGHTPKNFKPPLIQISQNTFIPSLSVNNKFRKVTGIFFEIIRAKSDFSVGGI